MRTPLLAAFLGLTLVGCLVGSDDIGNGDGDGNGEGSGDGSGSNNGSGTQKNPALDVSVDKATVSTELLTDNLVTVTLKGVGGFSGAVTLVGSVVDATGTALPGWTVTLDKASVDLAADGTATAVATVKVPAMTTAMSGTVKIDATSSLGTKSTSSTVTAANQLSITMTINNATCAKSALTNLTIAQGTKVIWKNGDAAKRITIHVGQVDKDTPVLPGFMHEKDPGMAPMTGTYEQTATAAGILEWYCHSPDDGSRYTITAK